MGEPRPVTAEGSDPPRSTAPGGEAPRSAGGRRLRRVGRWLAGLFVVGRRLRRVGRWLAGLFVVGRRLRRVGRWLAGLFVVGRRLRRVGRWLAGLFVVGSFVFWAWAFSPWARTENPGRLDDRTFVRWADQHCARARTAIDAMPSARQAGSRAEWADQVDRGTDEVEMLVADLRLRAEASLSVSAHRRRRTVRRVPRKRLARRLGRLHLGPPQPLGPAAVRRRGHARPGAALPARRHGRGQHLHRAHGRLRPPQQHGQLPDPKRRVEAERTRTDAINGGRRRLCLRCRSARGGRRRW